MSDDEGDAPYEDDDGVDDAAEVSASDSEDDDPTDSEEGSDGTDGSDSDSASDAGGGPAGAGAGGRPRRPVGGRPDPISRASNTSVRIVVVPPDQHMTSDRLCATEVAGLLAARAEQIARTGTNFARGAGAMHDPQALAYAELYEDRRCPLMVRRPIWTDSRGNTYVEDHNPNTMALPDLPRPGAR